MNAYRPQLPTQQRGISIEPISEYRSQCLKTKKARGIVSLAHKSHTPGKTVGVAFYTAQFHPEHDHTASLFALVLAGSN